MNVTMFSQTAAAAVAAPSNPKLISAAHEFEASLMKEFIKPLQHDSLFSEDSAQGEEDSAGSADALMSFGAEAMAKAISEHGGFGIAKKILEHLEKSSNKSSAPEKSMPHSI
jgi:peptidoglycan hydrolase FlgJ